MAVRRKLLMQKIKVANLFNINVPFQDPDNTSTSNTTKRVFTPNTHSKGMAWSNYFIPGQVTNYSITDGVLSVTNKNVYGVLFPFELTPESTYIVTAETVKGRVDYAFYASDGTYLSAQTNKLGANVTIPNNADMTVLIFYSNYENQEATFSNIQLKLAN